MVGGIFVVPLLSYCMPWAGQPPVSKVLTHLSLPASLGALSEGKTDKQTVNPTAGSQQRKKKIFVTSKLEYHNSVSWPPMIYNRLTTSEKQPSSTVNSRGSVLTSLHCRRPGSLQMAATGIKTRCSFGRERNQMNQDCMAWALQWETLLSAVEPPPSGTACILSLCLSTFSGPVSFLSICTPTLCSPAENKYECYDELESSIREIPVTEHLYLHMDFNTHVGANHDSWPSCIGHFGISQVKQEQTEASWVMLLPWPLHNQHNLCHQAEPQSILAAP